MSSVMNTQHRRSLSIHDAWHRSRLGCCSCESKNTSCGSSASGPGVLGISHHATSTPSSASTAAYTSLQLPQPMRLSRV
ncbi:hypothetical protein DQ04_11941020 [Trypanosoma grayi]|uniref:hypothetical protein n=1 Tax=Trypanosoma grayi TaxID=71804 RepID=UPI0004F3F733|nr:hypothetical protein DQ04_11941020 [Trypanosoma grayi]KEG06848.1 hypothetical protein DQ04_11941020 [Trypanosoma grayi]